MLQRALHSVYHQTRPPAEVIVVDDGSTDNTQSQMGPLFPKVTWITQENQGVSSARNQGIKKAKNEWIAFLDSDDEWHPQKLEIQTVSIINKKKISFFHTNEQWIRNGKKIKQPAYLNKSNKQIFYKSLNQCIISPSSVIIRKSLLENMGGFNESLTVCEDYDLWLRILAHHEVVYIPEKLVTKYGGHDDQLSTRYWGMDRFRVKSLKNLLSQPTLSIVQKTCILKVLIEKLGLLAHGFKKYEKHSQAEEFEQEKMKFSIELHNLAGKPTLPS